MTQSIFLIDTAELKTLPPTEAMAPVSLILDIQRSAQPLRYLGQLT